ncbi:MAG: threonine aldolase, partial [Bacteroidota bacterium]
LLLLPFVEEVVPVQTNLVFFKLKPEMPAERFLQALRDNDIHAMALAPMEVRFVTHLDITDEMIASVEKVLRSM